MALFSFQLRFKSIIIYNFGNLPLACFWHSYSDLLIRYRTWAVKSGTWERKTIHVRSYETRKTEKSSQMKEKQSKNEREREREQQLLSCKSPDTGGVTAVVNKHTSLPPFLSLCLCFSVWLSPMLKSSHKPSLCKMKSFVQSDLTFLFIELSLGILQSLDRK